MNTRRTRIYEGKAKIDIGFGFGARKSQFFGGPLAQELVAACVGPEPHFLVKGEFPLKTFLALVECRHSGLP